MKYGMRERISGGVILLALAVIFIPMLFDESPTREERPEPVLTIEQPVDIEPKPVEAPRPPASLGQIQDPLPFERNSSIEAATERPAAEPTVAEPAATEPTEAPAAQQATESESHPDPIAALTRQIDQQQAAQQDSEDTPAQNESASSARNGGWSVQVGSFKKPTNAEKLEAKLDSEGIDAFRRAREDDWTTVYVGSFETSEAAEKMRTELKEKNNINGFLVRVREGE